MISGAGLKLQPLHPESSSLAKRPARLTLFLVVWQFQFQVLCLAGFTLHLSGVALQDGLEKGSPLEQQQTSAKSCVKETVWG